MGDFDHPPRALADASKFFYVLPFSGKTKIIIFPLEEQQYADSRNIKLYICKTIFALSTSLNGSGGWVGDILPLRLIKQIMILIVVFFKF